jgi:hypothetical protein
MRSPSISLFQVSTKALSYFSASDTYTAHSFAAAASSSRLMPTETLECSFQTHKSSAPCFSSTRPFSALAISKMQGVSWFSSDDAAVEKNDDHDAVRALYGLSRSTGVNRHTETLSHLIRR